MKPPLSKHHQQTYNAIFQHPIVHDLYQRDVMAMLGALGEVTEGKNGTLKIMRNGQMLILHASHGKEITAMDELISIRHFIERSEDAVATEDHGYFLVVIDHREACIYKAELHGTVPQRITPFDPHGFGRNLRNVEDDADGQRRPESKAFYEAIAQTLLTATKILILGSGTGASSAMEQLLIMLREHHFDVAKRVVGSIAVDVQHLTEDQLLAKAREFYEKHILASAK